MSKNKTHSIDNLSEYSPDFVFTKIKDRTRQKLHPLTAKILQYQTKNYPPNLRKNHSLEEMAKRYVDVLVKQEKFKALNQMQNPESQNLIHQNEQDTTPQGQQNYELSEEDKIYLDSSILSYTHDKDSGKKWKININPQIDYSFLKDSEVCDLLSLMYMFENGYFPFVGKKQSKAKIFVQHMDNLKKRPSKQIETFKTPISKDYWAIFSFMVERLEKQAFAICVEIISIRKDLNANKIEHELDMRLSEKKYSIKPGEIKFFFDKDLKIKPELIYKFGDNSFFFPPNNAETTRRIFPSKIQHIKVDHQIPVEIQPEENFDSEVHIMGDNSNYESVRYIYKELENNDHFSYTLSPSEYEVLQTKGNLIVIGRSGTGKTTCALLRLFFKELNNPQKTQRNVFLTASSVLIAEINKKYDQLKDGIRQIHNYDYFEQGEIVIDERNFIKKFYDKIDEINETFMRQKFSSFLSCKVFPCFLTIREYIQSLDGMMQNPFFSTKNEENKVRNVEEQIIISYPDEIKWEQRVRKTRRIRYSNGQTENLANEQEWLEIKFDHFAKKICQLPQIKRISGSLSPEIMWSEIFSTIKGSSRAHSFFGKFLDFQTYIKESKNKFLDVEDKKRVYEVFTAYEKIKQATNQYDLLDVVNNIIIQLGKRQNHDLALSSLFIDEVQDLPPAFIFLAGKIVQQSLFFSGDTAQTISKGVSFRFSDIRDQFSEKYFQKGFKLEKPKIKQLGVNFRSQNQIIQLSNCLIRCLEMMFPDFIDHMPFEISPNSGPKPVIMSTKESYRLADVLKQQFGNLHRNNHNNLFGADKAIIVRNKEAKKRIPGVLGSMTCLTYQQCKGLEYNVVILYEFFTSAPEVQWSFLKHIELQSRSNGMKELAFNKNHLGSNIKMYFDLCSELKILYTVITRPRTILIICDDNVPQPLMRIWNFLDVIQRSETFFRDFEEQLNNGNNQNGPNNQQNPDNNQSNNRANERSNVPNLPENLNMSRNYDRNQQNFQKFRKQWIDEGFKLFFDHKLYDQAANCFQNAEIPELQNISNAFFYATLANNEAQQKTQQLDHYHRAGQIFDRYGRNYEAGKCFFLSEQYNKALRIFGEMRIKKYEAQCLWKMKEYQRAEQIFFVESMFRKCFNVLIESEYWFLMFKRLYEKPQDFKKIGSGTIRKGLHVMMESLLWTFTPWILQNWNVIDSYRLQNIITKVINLCSENNIEDKTWFFSTQQNEFLNSKISFLAFRPKKRQETDEIQENFVTRIYQIHGILEVLDTFFKTLMYVNDHLVDFHLNSHFKKYSLENLNVKTYDFDFSNKTKRWANSLQMILNILETFGCYQFIAKLASSLGFNNIQQLITIQNFLRIDAKKLDSEETEYKKNLHLNLINYLEDSSTKNKLSLLMLIYGWTKSSGHMYEYEDMLMSEYFGNFELTHESYTVKFKPLKIIKQHGFICFDENFKQDSSQRTIQASYQYQKIFSLIDDITPNSFFTMNQKEKDYIEYFKSLTQEEKIDLEQKQKLAVQQKLGELQKKIKRSQDDLVFTEKSKNEIFANTHKEEAKAVQQKIKIMKYIKKYIWTPQQCEKKLQKTYQLKKDIKQIKSERNKLLDAIDVKTDKKIEELRKREDIKKTISDLTSKLQTQFKNLTVENAIYMNKKQQVDYLLQIVKSIEQDVSVISNQRKQLESEKKGTKTHDKKLNHRIKILQDKIKEQSKNLNQNQKDYEKSMQKLKEVTQKIQGINNKIEELDYQIKQSKEFICQLNLVKLNDKGQLQYLYSPQYTKTLIKQYIVKWQPKIKEQGAYEKDGIVKDYKTILRDVDEYNYYHEDIPKKCQQDRNNILHNIENLKESIEKLHKQKEDEKLRTQAKVKVNFQSKCFKKHCWQYRKNYLTEMILQNPDLHSHLDTELINVINLIQRLTLPGSKTTKDQINKNSILLDEIILSGDSSFQKLWLILHFIIHQQQLQLLETTVVKEQYQRFLMEIEKFVENIKQQTESSLLAKNTLAILGINVIQPADDSDLKYLEGFSILEKNHNFATNLKTLFYHNISFTHVLCRTFEILQIVINYFKDKIKSSEKFRTFQRQQFITKKIKEFKMRNQQFIKTQEEYFIDLIRDSKFDHDHLTTKEVGYLKQDLIELKTIFVSHLIQLEEQQNVNVEIKAQKIVCVLEKIIELTNFVESLGSIIQFNKQSIKKVDGKDTFIDEATQTQAKELKNYLLPKIQKVMDKVTPPKPKDNQSTQASENVEIPQIPKDQEKPEKQPKQQIDPKIYEKGTMQQKKPRKKKNMPQNDKTVNAQVRVNRPKRGFYREYQEYNQQQHCIIQKKYEHKAYYNLITGQWVSQS